MKWENLQKLHGSLRVTQKQQSMCEQLNPSNNRKQLENKSSYRKQQNRLNNPGSFFKGQNILPPICLRSLGTVLPSYVLLTPIPEPKLLGTTEINTSWEFQCSMWQTVQDQNKEGTERPRPLRCLKVWFQSWRGGFVPTLWKEHNLHYCMSSLCIRQQKTSLCDV